MLPKAAVGHETKRVALSTHTAFIWYSSNASAAKSRAPEDEKSMTSKKNFRIITLETVG